jgi:hypothetical protein
LLNFLFPLFTAHFLPSLYSQPVAGFLILCALIVTMIHSRADHCIIE